MIELIKSAYGKTVEIKKNLDIYMSVEHQLSIMTDYLLENGVMVLPCKVGDTVYYPYKYHNKVLKYKVEQIIINDKGKWLDVGVMWFSFEDIGTAVFLTREEAEKALERSKQ